MMDQEEGEGPSSSNPMIKRRKISSYQVPRYPIVTSSPPQQETQDQEIEGGENGSQEYYDSDREEYVEEYVGSEIEEEEEEEDGYENQETDQEEYESENESQETDQEREDDNSSGNEEPGGKEVPMSENGSNSVVTLMDSDVLDCPICFAPFTIPVFQVDWAKESKGANGLDVGMKGGLDVGMKGGLGSANEVAQQLAQKFGEEVTVAGGPIISEN